MDVVATSEPAFLQALRDLAASDAEAVADFFRSQGLLRHASNPAQALHLPPETLLGIGLALRLRTWELNEITVHLEAGLPSAYQLLVVVRRFLSGPELHAVVEQLAARIVLLLHENFAWAGIGELQADVLLVVADEDEEFVYQIARFLWENRHALTAGENHE